MRLEVSCHDAGTIVHKLNGSAYERTARNIVHYGLEMTYLPAKPLSWAVQKKSVLCTLAIESPNSWCTITNTRYTTETGIESESLDLSRMGIDHGHKNISCLVQTEHILTQ